MQYSVPQFTDVEDKIVGPLTLKQFLILLAGAVILFILFRFMGSLILFILASLPVAGIFGFAAFGSYNGKTLGDLMVTGMGYVSEPSSYVFHKEVKTFHTQVRKRQKEDKNREPQLSPEEKLNRLHRLTYILDQDTKAEEELLREKYVHLK